MLMEIKNGNGKCSVFFLFRGKFYFYRKCQMTATSPYYKSTSRKWYCWCPEREVDKIKCSINLILRFSADCFHTGYEHGTIAGFRSAIAAYQDPLIGFQLGMNPG